MQTAGRAARHVNGEVILFADTQTKSIQALLAVSGYRREVQTEYNTKHGITPQTVHRAVQESLQLFTKARQLEENVVREGGGDFAITEVLRELEAEMAESAAKLEFERAALLRDQIRELKKQAGLNTDDTGAPFQKKKVDYREGLKGKRRGGKR